MNDRSVESFYGDFWAQGTWSGAEPNNDEQIRIRALDSVIAKHRLSGRILDLGCGRGCITAALARHGSIVGIDVVEAGIKVGRRLYPDLDLRHTSIQDLNCTDGASFDGVVSTEVIEHVPFDEQGAFVTAITQALKPGGWLLLTTPRAELQQLWRSEVTHEQPLENWLTEIALNQLLADVGLVVVEHGRAGVYPLTWWRVPLVISPVRALCLRVPWLRRLIDRAGIYQVVLAHKVEHDDVVDTTTD